MKRLLVPLSVVALGVAAAVPALATPTATSGSIVIRHEQRGCHTWSLNGGRFKAALETRLARGSSLTITKIDPMVQSSSRSAARGSACGRFPTSTCG